MYDRRPYTPDDVRRNESGLQKVHDILHLGGCVITDIDETLKYPSKFPEVPPDRHDPKLPEILAKLHARDIRLGIMTEQSPIEVRDFICTVAQKAPGFKQNLNAATVLFGGFWILEGGHVLKPAQEILVEDPAKEYVNITEKKRGAPGYILTRPAALVEMEQFKRDFAAYWVPNEDGYGRYHDIQPVIKMAPPQAQGIATISIHEKGPPMNSPLYISGTYERVMAGIKERAVEMGWKHIDFYEAGNGTLRVVQRGMNKSKALAMWHAAGAIDMSKLVYFCDGLNDIAAASLIHKAGGAIVTPHNAVPDLHPFADYISQEFVSAGIVEMLDQVLTLK